MKKRQKKSNRVRRTTFESSLSYATSKLERMLAERDRCSKRLEEMDKEIPYLQTVIRALSRPPMSPPVMPAVQPLAVAQAAITVGNSNRIVPLPPGIEQYLKPISDNVDELPSDEDALLNFHVPGEKELLP